MTINDHMGLLEKALGLWATENGGQIKVANDKPHLFEILGVSPGAPRVALWFLQEIPRSQQFDDLLGKVDRKYWAVVSRGRGFNAALGDSLTKGVAGGAPMYVLAEQVREKVRGIRLPDQNEDDNRPCYKGIYPTEFEGVNVDAYYVEFTLAADIPEQK